MSSVAIQVEGLSKRYRIGVASAGHYRYKRLGESLGDLLTAPLARLRATRRSVGGLDRSSRAEFWALEDVSFEVRHGEAIGIIGRNGAGKSTLLKLISRITEPTKGRIGITGRVASLLEVGTGFHPELTGRENVFLNGAILGMSRQEIARKFDEIVAFAEVEKFIDTQVKHYSSGMYLRLAFAVAAHLEPEILIVDEVLAVGDMAFQQKCMGQMSDIASQGRTVLFVSHNLAAVRKLCSTALLLDSGHIAARGSVVAVIGEYHDAVSQLIASDSHIIYQCNARLRNLPHIIDRVELLNGDEEPMRMLHTWDKVRFRLWYRAQETMRGGSVVLLLKTLEGNNVILCSTTPDRNVALDFMVGEHYVDCIFEKFPLAAGKYIVGIALAQPHVAWLFRDEEAALVEVHPADVFLSGLAPQSDRMLVAIEHEWQIG